MGVELVPVNELRAAPCGAGRQSGDHPLNAADAERSRARIADVELGLTHPIDASYWRSKAEERIRALEEDEPVYGLVPHEVDELAALKRLLGNA